MRLFALLTLGGLVACSGASADAVSTPAPGPSSSADVQTTGGRCAAVTADACKPAFHVASALELVGAARAFDYQRVSVTGGKALDAGDDLVADADLEVLASDLGAAGSECEDNCHSPLFRTQGFPRFEPVPGVTCLERSEQPVREAFACARLAIAKGTTFRLRAVIEDMHPSAPTYWAFIDVTEPCATSCGAGEVLCASSHTCFAAGYEACAFCEGGSSEVCACRSKECGSLPEGTSCTVTAAPDLIASGICRANVCRRAP